MQIILLEPVRKLGAVGDVVKVKNGYARNFLLPNKKALRATEENIAYFEVKKKEIQAANNDKIAIATKVAKKIEKAVVTLVQQAGEDGRLYGSVNAVDISEALTTQVGVEISRKQVVLHAPIKYIGVHTVEVALHGDMVVKVHPNVARSEDDAKSAAQRFAKGEKVMEGPGADEDKKSSRVAAPQAEEAEVPVAEEAEDAKPKKAKKPKKEAAEADAEEAAE